MALSDVARKTEKIINRVSTARAYKAGWKPTLVGYHGYGDAERVRVLARVLMQDPAAKDNDAPVQRGFRQFFTVQVGGHPVTAHVGDAVVHTRTDDNGYVDIPVPDHGLEPGWHTVRLEVAGGEDAHAEVLVVEPGTKVGIVSDIDDTVMITWLPRALIAAYNSWFLRTNARKPVPGMAQFYAELREKYPQAPVFYLSTGAWNTFPALENFLLHHGFPKGPMLLTDWGPTQNKMFRSGQEHKKVQLRNLIIDFPDIQWILIGDDGQHDPLIYTHVAAEHPNRVKAIALRELTPGEHVLAHGTAMPIDDPSPSAKPLEEFEQLGGELPAERRNHPGIPVISGKDGYALADAWEHQVEKAQQD